jgi:membrane-associated protein
MQAFFDEIARLFLWAVEVVFHLDTHLAHLTSEYGGWTYVLLFSIIFSETGLVVTPFLPGDSLLFAVGAVCALEGSGLDMSFAVPLLILAAFLGNTVNYAAGFLVGPRVFSREDSVFLNKKYLKRAQDFYDRHGALTIIVTRFAPILRTFAPFVAGVGKMHYAKFLFYNFVGALLWGGGFIAAGFFFGNLPMIQRNFHLVILAIILLSFVPMAVTWLKSTRSARGSESR